MSISSISSTTSTYQVAGTDRRQPPKPPSMDNTADLLGLSAQELEDARKQGKTLADLAKEKGVSTDDLTAAVTADLKANKPEGAPDLSDAQLTQMATDIINGKGPHGHGHHGPPPAGGDDTDTTVTQNVSDVAASTGTDISTLLEKLQSGDTSSADDIIALLTKSSSANYGTSLSDLISGGLSVDTYA
jgi:uncharacterized protein YidB (DUF937 family)